MSLKKILMKGTTRMSLHERFTFLRTQSAAEPSQTVHVQSVRQGLFSGQGQGQQASAKNRRLAQMMDRRPTVMAALRLKKQILKQRLGQVQRPGLSVKDRLSLRGRGGLRGRVGLRGTSIGRSPLIRQPRLRGGRGNRRGGGRGNLSRSQSLNNLSRSQSMQSLNARPAQNRTYNRFQNRTFNNQEFRRGGRGRGIRSRDGGFIRNRDDFVSRRGGRGGRFNNRVMSRGFRSRGGGRGGSRGGGRGVGRGRGGSRGRGRQMPTKEELDSQLDQYMAGSRGMLDQDLDTYMTQEESWD